MEFELSLVEVATVTGGTVHGEDVPAVRSMVIDSRTLFPSNETLFVALKGERHDGHDYLSDLFNRGIRSFLVSQLPDISLFPGAGFCLVKDTLRGLQALASARRAAYSGTVAAITGSNGKTIVKEWIYQCLGESLSIHRSPKSYNSQVGVPLSVWMTSQDNDLALFEAGISLPGEMERLREITKPEIGILTNIGTAHQENFDSLEQKLAEKTELFIECKKVICRLDVLVGGTPLADHMSRLKAEIVGWSLRGNAPYRYRFKKRNGEGTCFSASTPSGTYSFELPFSDEASIENALHALTFSLEMGMTPEIAAERVGKLEPVSMRLEMLQGILGSVLINDTYNADIGGLVSALDLMNQHDSNRGKCLILSDMLQSGLDEPVLSRQIADQVREKGINQFIGIGPALSRNRSFFPRQSRFFLNTSEFLSRIDKTVFRERTVLIKGSRSFGFERITRELQLKNHQTLLEIDLNAMLHNLNYFRSLLNDGVRTMVMVKALSYGSGSIEIASLLQYHQVDSLAVAFIDEGVNLRNAGIHLPVLVLNPDPSGYAQMIDFRLEPEIFSFRGLDALLGFLRYRGIEKYPVHIKVDTGMHRLGFTEEDMDSLIPLLENRTIRVASVFTHLAASDEPRHDDFTRRQITSFDRITGEITAALHQPFEKHVLNTSGIERFPDAQYDMVRLGIGLHGIGAWDGLIPASSFRTIISQIRKVQAGETIGYSRKDKVDRDSLIATLPVGYADGMDRRLGNGKASLYVKGHFAPTMGNICMDMTMIDVTGLDVSEGDEVEIFGKHQPVQELARKAGTIPYEILTSIPERVKRVYLQE